MKTIFFVTFWVVIGLGFFFGFAFAYGAIDALTWFICEFAVLIGLGILGCASE